MQVTQAVAMGGIDQDRIDVWHVNTVLNDRCR